MDEAQDLGWLIRDNGNRIRGPFKQSEIVQLIKKGQLKGKTEIARANTYWFAVEEKAELARFFPEFNGGKPPAEQPTQMTATLTEADVRDHGIEATQFTSTSEIEGLKEKQKAAEENQGKIEWLSDELADEFGSEFDVTISVQTDVSGMNVDGVAGSNSVKMEEDPNSKEDAAKQEMLRRNTVNADTLPSERKDFQGERPKPIDALIRNPSKASSSPAGAHGVVNVPVEPGLTPKMFNDEEEVKIQAKRDKRNKAIFSSLAILVLVAIGAFLFTKLQSMDFSPKTASAPARKGVEAIAAARQSVLLFDLEGAKGALSDLESEPESRGDPSTYLLQAVVKKEFLYDVEGAMLALQTAKAQARNKRSEAEVDNLMAIYSFERDPSSAFEILRRNMNTFKDDPVFRYNVALGLVRTGKFQEAISLLETLLPAVSNDLALVEDVATALGWAHQANCGASPRSAGCKRGDAETAYLRAISSNPDSSKARLGLALYRLKHTGVKSAEPDFRSFIDSAPDLDPPTRVINFRKLSSAEFYSFAHEQIADLNTPGPTLTKPSPLVMAADAVVSAIQSRTDEAGKMIESALSAAPGDGNVLKALGYLRWKQAKLDEVVEVLKDLRERNSFAIHLMLGKTYVKQRKLDLAAKHFRALVEIFPNRSESHALLGEFLLEHGEKGEEAKNELQLAVKKDPLDLIAWRGLVRAGSSMALSTDLQRNLPF